MDQQTDDGEITRIVSELVVHADFPCNNLKNQIAKKLVNIHGWKRFWADVSNYHMG